MTEEKIVDYQPCVFCKGTGRKQPTNQTCEVCKGSGQMPIYEKKNP
jgi:DnaJ-class molecular chaperone